MNTAAATIAPIVISVATEAAACGTLLAVNAILREEGAVEVTGYYVVRGTSTIHPKMPVIRRTLTAAEANEAVQMGTDGQFYLVIPQGPIVKFTEAEAAELVIDHVWPHTGL